MTMECFKVERYRSCSISIVHVDGNRGRGRPKNKCGINREWYVVGASIWGICERLSFVEVEDYGDQP